MRKTKIVCTIGPATNSEQKIKSLIESGMNVARINMSHGTNQQHIETITMVKNVREKMGESVGVMVDLKGPEVRIGSFENGKITLKQGNKFTFDVSTKLGNETRVGISTDKILPVIKKGQKLLLADGSVEMVVENVRSKSFDCKVVGGGVLSNNKSINFPGLNFNMEYLSEIDKLDILMAISQGAEFLSLSVVQSKEDVHEVRRFLEKNNGGDIKLIAKIESRNGVKNMEEIIEAADGVMVARGDLGVEVDFVKLPHIQNKMLSIAQMKHKMSITATQMLVSMVKESRPTRAEITDIANAIVGGSGAVMLSEETAIGAHPCLCVRTMAKIALECEKHINQTDMSFGKQNNKLGGVCVAAVSAAYKSKLKCIAVATGSGRSAEEIAAYRPKANIFAFTPNEQTFNQMSLVFGVQAYLIKVASNGKKLWETISNELVTQKAAVKAETIVYVAGEPSAMENSVLEIKQI